MSRGVAGTATSSAACGFERARRSERRALATTEVAARNAASGASQPDPVPELLGVGPRRVDAASFAEGMRPCFSTARRNIWARSRAPPPPRPPPSPRPAWNYEPFSSFPYPSPAILRPKRPALFIISKKKKKNASRRGRRARGSSRAPALRALAPWRARPSDGPARAPRPERRPAPPRHCGAHVAFKGAPARGADL